MPRAFLRLGGKRKSIVIEWRWAEEIDHLTELAAELVRLKADVIVKLLRHQP